MLMMHATMEELRQYKITTRVLLEEGRDALSVMVAVDSRLVEVANHVAICHRSIAEARAELPLTLFSRRRALQAKIEATGAVLEELDAIQYELIDVKGECISRLRAEIAGLHRSVRHLMEKS